MTARKKAAAKAPQPPPASYSVSNCTIHQVGVEHNEHTAAAITALANGVIENAKALKAAAKALAGHGVQMGNGINIGHP